MPCLPLYSSPTLLFGIESVAPNLFFASFFPRFFLGCHGKIQRLLLQVIGRPSSLVRLFFVYFCVVDGVSFFRFCWCFFWSVSSFLGYRLEFVGLNLYLWPVLFHVHFDYKVSFYFLSPFFLDLDSVSVLTHDPGCVSTAYRGGFLGVLVLFSRTSLPPPLDSSLVLAHLFSPVFFLPFRIPGDMSNDVFFFFFSSLLVHLPVASFGRSRPAVAGFGCCGPGYCFFSSGSVKSLAHFLSWGWTCFFPVFSGCGRFVFFSDRRLHFFLFTLLLSFSSFGTPQYSHFFYVFRIA